MGNPLKKALLTYQLRKCQKNYQKRKEYLSDPYMRWIEENEGGFAGCRMERRGAGHDKEAVDHEGRGGNIVRHLSVAKFNAITAGENTLPKEEWLCITDTNGVVTPFLPEILREYLLKDSKTGLIYGDEDMYDPALCQSPALSGGSVENQGEAFCHIPPLARYGPWFKPKESPETLLSFFYYGSVILLKTGLVREALEEFAPVYSLKDCTKRQYFYDFILYFTDYLNAKGKTVSHVSGIIFHGEGSRKIRESLQKPEPVNDRAYWGYEPEYDACKLAALKRRGLAGEMRHYVHCHRSYSVPCYKFPKEPSVKKDPVISVIIPSKDNMKMLTLCIDSIRKNTKYPFYEIIVVDNGSSEENRKQLERMAEERDFVYLFKPMEFHFSKMCNLGAEAAKGEYLLFLNDDMEAVSRDFMETLAGQAACPGIGAAGAKLLYPGSDMIQHAGISNIAVGPVHKLQKAHDKERDYYYGKNTLPLNVIGVTAACLMVKKERFLETGGFPLEAAVSYNDVELCFRLHEQGYRSVVRNDVVLYHHESVSRGDDRMDDDKWERLLKEKDGVYKRHPLYEKEDPYYNQNLTGFKPQFFCSWLYSYERRDRFSEISVYKKRIRQEWYNNCLTVTIEHKKLEPRLWLEEKDNCYLIEGWAYVLNMDNSRYKRRLLLTGGEKTVYEVSLWERFRPDVAGILKEQENIELSGFSCRIPQKSLKPGKYRISLLFEDRCSRQKLYKECEETLNVL